VHTIVNKSFNNKKVNYIIVKDDPWFRGKDIATILEYADTKQAIRVNVDTEDKQKLEKLRGVLNTPLDYNELNTTYINEAGLYSLILGSKKKEAKLFKKWVCSEVLPSIRQTGSYMTKEAAIEKWGLIDNDESKAKLIVNSPTGERALHYDIVKYIRKTYPNVILTSSLGENQITHLTRLDSYHKGYQRGTPDLELKCKVGDSVDVVAIELKFGSNVLSIEQEDYLDKLNKINVTTFVAYKYEDIVIFLHEHYKRINETKHNSPNRMDFSTNQNPNFWIQRLMNKNNILQQAEYRNLDVNNLWKLPNRDIVSILISYDKKGS
jgi:prophage antirepressor-like protein